MNVNRESVWRESMKKAVAVKGSHFYSVDEDEEGFFSIAIYSVIDDS